MLEDNNGKSGETSVLTKKRGGTGKQPKSNRVPRRDRVPYKALDPSVNLKTRRDEIADLSSYAGQLSKEELEWLNAFSEEYVCANFNHGGVKLHTSREDRKLCTDRNNARNRCIYTRETAMEKLNQYEDINQYNHLKEDESEE